MNDAIECTGLHQRRTASNFPETVTQTTRGLTSGKGRVRLSSSNGSLKPAGINQEKMIDPHLRIRRAIRADDALLVRRILRSHPNLLHNPDLTGSREEAGNSNLHLAAKLGHVEIVRLLLSLGHESPAVGPALNEQHQTALMLAAAAGHTEVVHAIAEADPSVIHRRDSRGRDAVMEAALGGHDTCLQILLTYVPGGAYEAVRQADLEGNTALHYASSKGNMLVLRTLLAAGADADRRNVWLWTAVEYSQSVQSEVYLKNLIADMEKRRASKREAVRDERVGTSGRAFRNSNIKIDPERSHSKIRSNQAYGIIASISKSRRLSGPYAIHVKSLPGCARATNTLSIPHIASIYPSLKKQLRGTAVSRVNKLDRQPRGQRPTAQSPSSPPFTPDLRFPYPAVKCIIGQYFLSIATPRRYWAWLIVCGFFDADNNEIWHKEIFISQDCERGYSHSARQYDNGPLPPRWAALGQLPHPSDDLSNIRIRGYKTALLSFVLPRLPQLSLSRLTVHNLHLQDAQIIEPLSRPTFLLNKPSTHPFTDVTQESSHTSRSQSRAASHPPTPSQQAASPAQPAPTPSVATPAATRSATASANTPLPPVNGPPPPPVLPQFHQATMAYSGTGFNARWGPDGGGPPNYMYGSGRGMYGHPGPYANMPMQFQQPAGFGYCAPNTPVMMPYGMAQQAFNPYGGQGYPRPVMTPGGRPPYPYPILDGSAPSANMTNSTGGVGCEPGYSYFFPPEHTKIHFLRTGPDAPWQLPPGTHIEFTAAHVPTNITIAQLMKGFGASNSNPRLNNIWEVLPAGNGKWYKGMQFNGDDSDSCKKTLKEVGWDKTRSGLPGESPVVYLYVTKD
ncbi:hypothetical protein PoMZ_04891 [Pyricularia oryzae]|nr:hypothetical protein PoMZ_04891 [Pyricularia oryzae]